MYHKKTVKELKAELKKYKISGRSALTKKDQMVRALENHFNNDGSLPKPSKYKKPIYNSSLIKKIVEEAVKKSTFEVSYPVKCMTLKQLETIIKNNNDGRTQLGHVENIRAVLIEDKHSITVSYRMSSQQIKRNIDFAINVPRLISKI